MLMLGTSSELTHTTYIIYCTKTCVLKFTKIILKAAKWHSRLSLLSWNATKYYSCLSLLSWQLYLTHEHSS